MNTIDHVQIDEYTATVTGNGGESQCVIITSCGQDGRTRVVVVWASVDGGISIRYVHNIAHGSVPMMVQTAIEDWASHGVPPTEAQWHGLTKDIGAALYKILKAWGLAD